MVLETQKRTLPPRLHEKDGGFYYVFRNRWTYVADSKAKALRRYIEEFADSERLRRAAAMLMSSPLEMTRYMARVYQRARKNARIRKIEFRLSKEEFDAIVKRANGLCEVSGVAFDLQLRPYSFRRPYAPSLDRIDSREPYMAENCRLVCCIVNAAMSDWGAEPFQFVAAAMAAKAGWYEPDET
jgi:hypothetical protein